MHTNKQLMKLITFNANIFLWCKVKVALEAQKSINTQIDYFCQAGLLAHYFFYKHANNYSHVNDGNVLNIELPQFDFKMINLVSK